MHKSLLYVLHHLGVPLYFFEFHFSGQTSGHQTSLHIRQMACFGYIKQAEPNACISDSTDYHYLTSKHTVTTKAQHNLSEACKLLMVLKQTFQDRK